MKESVLRQMYAYNANERLFLEGRKKRVSSMRDPGGDNIIPETLIRNPDQMIDVMRHTRFLPVPLHRHSYIEGIYIYNGSLVQNIDGERVVMHKGDLMILNQGISHSIEVTGQSDIAINLIILPEFFQYLLSLADTDNYIMNFIMDCMYDQSGMGSYLWYHAQSDGRIHELMDEVIENLYDPTPASAITIKLLVGLVLVQLVERSDAVEIYAADHYEKRIGLDIMRYIDEHFREGSLTQISAELNQPEWRVCRIIKRYTGRTFKQLVQDTRLAKAARLLEGSGLPATEVAHAVGYNNMTYFYRLFKERYGTTPAAYRSEARRGDAPEGEGPAAAEG